MFVVLSVTAVAASTIIVRTERRHSDESQRREDRASNEGSNLHTLASFACS